MTFATFAKLCIIAASAPFNGWVLSHLWLWFIVPLGVVHLSVTMAMGIIVTVALINWSSVRVSSWFRSADDARVTDLAVLSWAAPAIALAAGYACTWLGTF